MNDITELLAKNNWTVETWFANNTMFVAHRGYSIIIGYPGSNKYRENGVVEIGLRERIIHRKCKKWFSEQLVAKDKYIEELLQNRG